MRLRWLALLVAFLACLAPIAHVLEMPNKLRLDGPLWLAVQQHLYAGWGPIIGAPTELGGLLISVVLCAIGRRRERLLFGLAAAAYVGMLLCFFLLNAPVNAAMDGWTPATLPADWTGYRWRWEIGHALAALFALLGLAATGAAVLGKMSSD